LSTKIAIPSRGRLRENSIELLSQIGVSLKNLQDASSRTVINEIEFIEMRSRDAARYLAAGKIQGAFLSTDIALEFEFQNVEQINLSEAASTLVVAVNDLDERNSINDLSGAVIATHLPNITKKWIIQNKINAEVIEMDGSLEGVCSSGLADGIVDLRQSGKSLLFNGLKVLDEICECQAQFIYYNNEKTEAISKKISSVLKAKDSYYIMFHINKKLIGNVCEIFPGMKSPTVIDLFENPEMSAIHMIIPKSLFWEEIVKMKKLGAVDIVVNSPLSIWS
jgi:ATP phosphoribosyltransferase